jgi:hypothetical protein
MGGEVVGVEDHIVVAHVAPPGEQATQRRRALARTTAPGEQKPAGVGEPHTRGVDEGATVTAEQAGEEQRQRRPTMEGRQQRGGLDGEQRCRGSSPSVTSADSVAEDEVVDAVDVTWLWPGWQERATCSGTAVVAV